MSSASHRLEFGPPPTAGLSRALVLAVLAHLVLLGALTLGVQWRRTAPTVEVQAELWSAIPKAAAPRRVEPPPLPPPPAPVAVARPVPAPPSPDADIALQREKQRLAKEKQVAAQQREQERLAALEKKREQELREAEQKQKLAVQKKQEQERQAALDKQRAQEQREKEKLAAEKKREREREREREQERLQAQQAKEDQIRLEAQRQVNLQRMAGLAGASGAPGATGTVLKASGPSSSYGGRVSAIVKPNIVFTDNPQDNPTALVEVRAAPDGTIVGRKLIKSSGSKAWDDAVLKAIDKTAVLPRDIDGTVPPLLEINFRRRD